ncbi:unnamed protein product [Tuber aestivum]|uniref:ATP-dependent rRNA helicase SPB4-like C-terminal extension domain-containing protein n=1 Tax=Tuber aestivum TaxID=59557 RepID=A0A292PUB0_9PEZI|nr:unnamed protein product [Tuber aestivum]
MFLLPGPEEGYVDAVLKNGKIKLQMQLEVERWVLADKAVMDLAKKAWGSHILAYTTHVAAEKGMFSHRALHYGHLAKSFGTRDAPGDIRGGATGGGKGRGNATGSAATVTSAKAGVKRSLVAENAPSDAGLEAVRKMRKTAFSMQMEKGMASEFNIG